LTLPICGQKDFISLSAANFARDYREHTAQYNWLMATVDLLSDYAAEESLSAFTLPNSRVNLPVVNLPELRFSVNDAAKPFRKSYMPFGGLQIIEALAFILEAMHLRHYCGPEYETKLNEVVLASPDGLNYAIVNGLVQVILGIFPLEATLHACLFALCTPGPQFDIEQHHPGWRFIHVLLELSEGDEYNIAAFSKAVTRLCRKKGWVHPREVLQESKKYVQAQLRHNAKTPGTADLNVVKAYNELYYGYSDILVDYHLGTNFPDCHPFAYLEDLQRLPRQPMSRFLQPDGTYKIVSPDLRKGRTLINWSVLEHLVHELAVSGDLNCPFKVTTKLKNSCPMMTPSCGRQLEYVNEGGHPCFYGESLYGLGIIDASGASRMHLGRLSDADPLLATATAADTAAFGEQSGKCDLCGKALRLTAVTVISVQTLNSITGKGFVPLRMRVPDEITQAGMTRGAFWAAVLNAYQTSEWGVCNLCRREVEEFSG
jgi:hypothetical protein